LTLVLLFYDILTLNPLTEMTSQKKILKLACSLLFIAATQTLSAQIITQTSGAMPATNTPFTHTLQDVQENNPYLYQLNNIRRVTESTCNYYSPNNTSPASIIFRYDFNEIFDVPNYSIEQAYLTSTVSLFNWTSPVGEGSLSVSTNGDNWTELMSAVSGQTSPTGSQYGFTYDDYLPTDLLLASSELWLKIDLHAPAYYNMAQFMRHSFSSNDPAFSLFVNTTPPSMSAVPEPSLYGIIGAIALVGLIGIKRIRRAHGK